MKARHEIRVGSVAVSPGGERVTAQKRRTGRGREDKQMWMGGN